MKTRSLTLLILLLAFVALEGCYYDKEDELYADYYASKNCDTVDVSYATDIEPIIDGKCATTGCHVGGGSGNGFFDNYNGVKAKVDNGSFLQRTLVTRDMPPSTALSDCQIKILQSWLNAGAPNN